jgi:hypothetical protein
MLTGFSCSSQLLVLAVRTASRLRAPIGQQAGHGPLLVLKEWAHSVLEHIGCPQRRFPSVALATGPFPRGIPNGLLVNPPPAFARAHVARRLCAPLARTLHSHPPPGLRGRCALSLTPPGALRSAYAALAPPLAARARRRVGRVSSCGRPPPPRPPAAAIGIPPLAHSVAAHHWPHAACSRAIPRLAASLSGAPRFLRSGWRPLHSGSAASPFRPPAP